MNNTNNEQGLEIQEDLIRPDKTQLQIGLKVKEAGILYRLKKRLKTFERNLEIMPFWRDILFVFMGTSSILIPAYIILLLIYKFNSLPDKIPLFFNSQDSQRLLIDKNLLNIMLIIYIVINLLLLNLIHSVYYYDRRLAKIIAFNISLMNILLFIASNQILSILLI